MITQDLFHDVKKKTKDYKKLQYIMDSNKFKADNTYFDDSPHPNHKWLPDNKFVFSLLLLLLALLTALNIFTNKTRMKKLKLLWKSDLNRWQILAIFLFVAYAFIFYPPISYMVVACKIGLYAMIIALCAYLQIPFIPFWITHFFVYFSQNFIIV
jgi:hypothetical protein